MRLTEFTPEEIDAAVLQVEDEGDAKRLSVETLVGCQHLRMLAYRTLLYMPKPVSEERLFAVFLGALLSGIEIGLALKRSRTSDGS